MTMRKNKIAEAKAIVNKALKTTPAGSRHHERLCDTLDYFDNKAAELETDPIDIRDISHVAQFGGMAR